MPQLIRICIYGTDFIKLSHNGGAACPAGCFVVKPFAWIWISSLKLIKKI